MNEWLLILVFLPAIAWCFGYLRGKKSLYPLPLPLPLKKKLSKHYFTGLNYLLNEKPDKAIDTFIEMLTVDSETIETHLALGTLFRKRGEVDKAIRIHQNLIARPTLSDDEKNYSLFELGLDYMSAGLLDRAENIFKKLSVRHHYKEKSFLQLLCIYQQSKDWLQAIHVGLKIIHTQKPMIQYRNIPNEIGHFYCELANESLKKCAYSDGIRWIKKALKIDPLSIRTVLILGTLYFSKKEYKKAIQSFTELTQKNILFLPEVLPMLIESFCYRKEKEALLTFLKKSLSQGAGSSILLAYSNLLQEKYGYEAAEKFISEQMQTHLSIKGLLKLIELYSIKYKTIINSENDIDSKNDKIYTRLITLKALMEQSIKNIPLYHCHSCGFDSQSLLWQCPRCQHWGSIHPLQGFHGE
jgi:lipopolysaccharide biosynthesis regulator YciM